MATGSFGPTWRDVLDGTALDVDFDNDTFKKQLVTDSYTPNFNTHDHEADITNEVSGTGYSAGGATMTGVTWTIASGYATLDANDTSWSSSTISSIRGDVMVDDTLTNDPLICARTFGSDYAVTSGTLTITEPANGISRLKYDPSA